MSLLKMIWEEQRNYNEEIRNLENDHDLVHWTEVYTLGLISEIDELLSNMNWKRNRSANDRPADVHGIAAELTDLTKYVFSLWQLWGFTADHMLSHIAEKNAMLEFLLKQEMSEMPEGRNVLICDIDGVIADWRKTFIWFLRSEIGEEIANDAAHSLHIDTDINLRYTSYYEYKEKFEREGWYSRVQPYSFEIETIRSMKKYADFYVVFVTARPYRQYKRIWLDTWNWLKRYNLPIDELHFVTYDRITMARNFGAANNVIMFEDDPKIIRRACNDEIQIICKNQPYNEEILNDEISRKVVCVDRITYTLVEEFIPN